MYDYFNLDEIKLNDFIFNEYITNIKITKYMEPSELKFSTITCNTSLIPIIKDLDEKLQIFKNYIPENFKNLINDELLKNIYINRIIIDGLDPKIFFDTLTEKSFNKKFKLEKACLTILNLSSSTFIDIFSIYDNIELNENTISSVFMRNKETKSIDNYVNTKKGFRNQISFRMKSFDKKRIINVMLFQNGKMTLTGCRNTEDIENISNYIKNFLNNFSVNNKKICNYELEIKNIVFHSINCHFNLNFQINNNELSKILKNCPEIDFLMYKPNTYPGLKCRFKENIEKKYKGGLIIFFQSGKINIYRTKNFEEINFLYEFINKLVKENFEKLII